MPATDVAIGEPRELAARIIKAHGHDAEWLDRFAEQFERRRGGRELRRILAVWGLSQAEAGRLLGVSRQAVGKWLSQGAPVDRATAVADLAAATDLLVRYLKRDRIPAVVRRPAPALAGRSLLDLMGAGDTREVLEACRQMFDVARVHG